MDRIRDLTIGSPSACLNSSLSSCLVMRNSRRQWKRAQTRSSATRTIVAMLIADTSRIAVVRTSSGTAVGSPNNAFTVTASSACKTIVTTMLIAINLKTDFANSTRPWLPNIRPQPLRDRNTGEVRLNSLEHDARHILKKRRRQARPRPEQRRSGARTGPSSTPIAAINSMASAPVSNPDPGWIVDQSGRASS